MSFFFLYFLRQCQGLRPTVRRRPMALRVLRLLVIPQRLIGWTGKKSSRQTKQTLGANKCRLYQKDGIAFPVLFKLQPSLPRNLISPEPHQRPGHRFHAPEIERFTERMSSASAAPLNHAKNPYSTRMRHSSSEQHHESAKRL